MIHGFKTLLLIYPGKYYIIIFISVSQKISLKLIIIIMDTCVC